VLWHARVGARPVSDPLPSSLLIAQQMVKKTPKRTPNAMAVPIPNVRRVAVNPAMMASRFFAAARGGPLCTAR